MATWIVTRHPGALQWMRRQGVVATRVVAHLDTNEIADGDEVIGTLPVPLVAEVCARGARYLHLRINMPVELRGKELTEDQMNAMDAALEEFSVCRGHLAGSSIPKG